MNIFCSGLVVCLLWSVDIGNSEKNAKENYEEYVYQDYDDSHHKNRPELKSDGQRLVNAVAVKDSEFPFVAAFHVLNKKLDKLQEIWHPICTSSIISPNYAITAAHCFFQPSHLSNEQCAESKGKEINASKSEDFVKDVKIKCEVIENGSLKITITDENIFFYLLLQAQDANRRNGKHEEGKIVDIEYFIRHKNAYDSKGRGGHDILLMKLKEPVSLTPACLPGEDFQDHSITAKLAGFGSYFRTKCLTNSQGPMKGHYCQTDVNCVMGHMMKNCFPQFKDNRNREFSGCVKTESTPAQFSRLCSKFIAQSGISAFPNSLDDIHLIYLNKETNKGKFLETCYRTSAESGWCRTDGNYYNPSKPTVGEVPLTTECYQDTNQESSGVLRSVKEAAVTSEKYCRDFYKKSLSRDGADLSTVLCVGKNTTIKYRVYYTTDDPNANETIWGEANSLWLRENSVIIETIYRNNQIDPDNTGYYISSTGSCHGDSGGPLFMEYSEDGEEVAKEDEKEDSEKRFVLTGVASGGRSKLGLCGGIHNPTLYVRVKRFLNWIRDVVGKEEDLCIINKTEDEDETL